MKKCLGVIFVLVLTVTLVGFKTGTAVADDQTWIRIENIQIEGQGLLLASADILAFDVAADSNTIWVAIGQRVFKSSNGGAGFAEPNTVATGITIMAITISPDYASDKTIFVASKDNIFRSTDDGNSWFPFAGAGAIISPDNEVITSMDVAKDASSNLQVLVGTRDPDVGDYGEVWLYKTSTGTWTDRNVAVGGTANKWESITVTFSPNHPGDGVKFAVVTADNLAAPAHIVTQFSDADWGFNWFDSAAIGTAGAFTRADLAFPADFDVINVGRTYYFLGLVNTTAVQGDAFRIAGHWPGSGLTKSEVRDLDLNVGVYSVAFTGNTQGGTLLAGLSARPIVQRTTDTLASQPMWTPSAKNPFGQGSTTVRAATGGGTVWASTQGAEGGFHISTDSGDAFNGVGGGSSSEVRSPVPDSPSARPAAFTTTDLAISPAEVSIGETLTISLLVANTGDLPGSYEVALKIDNVAVATRDVTLAGGDSQTVVFTTTKDVAGIHTVSINGLSGTFTVREAPVPAAFATSDLTISPTTVDIGENVTISVLVTNTGELTGSYEVALKIDNVAVATRDVTLAGGDSQTVVFTTTKDVAGTYTMNVNELSGTFMARTTTAQARPTNWLLIGAIVIGPVVIGLVLYILSQRKRDTWQV
ncbi:CARDB domain-containing protein [Chloroflexota bacterium]